MEKKDNNLGISLAIIGVCVIGLFVYFICSKAFDKKIPPKKGQPPVNNPEPENPEEECNTYECYSGKEILNNQEFYGFISDDLYFVVIYDGENDRYALLDNKNEKVLGEYSLVNYLCFEGNILCDMADEAKYIIAQSSDTGKFGILDLKGKIVKDFTMDLPTEETEFFTYFSGVLRDVYSISKDLIVARENGKYGILKISKNSKVVDYIYDNVRLLGDYFKALIDGKWYLYNYNNKKLIDEGYDYIFLAKNNLLIVELDKKIYFKDLDGNNLTEDYIIDETPNGPVEFACCSGNRGVDIWTDADNPNVIVIQVSKSYEEDGEDNKLYKYYIDEKTITME